MGKARTAVFGVALVALASFMLSTSAWAGSGPLCCGGGDSSGGPVRKLSRGVANSITGVLEVPYTMAHVQKRDGVIPAMSWGVISGVQNAVVRTVVGMTELMTFPFRFPNNGYGPMLKPEFIQDNRVS